jgi:hypothetical protein
MRARSGTQSARSRRGIFRWRRPYELGYLRPLANSCLQRGVAPRWSICGRRSTTVSRNKDQAPSACGRQGSMCRRNERSAREVPKPCSRFTILANPLVLRISLIDRLAGRGLHGSTHAQLISLPDRQRAAKSGTKFRVRLAIRSNAAPQSRTQLRQWPTRSPLPQDGYLSLVANVVRRPGSEARGSRRRCEFSIYPI